MKRTIICWFILSWAFAFNITAQSLASDREMELDTTAQVLRLGSDTIPYQVVLKPEYRIALRFTRDAVLLIY